MIHTGARQEVPYRRKLVDLPLQQSMFARLPASPDVLGLASTFPNGFHAWIDDSGDLYVDRSHVDTLIEAIRAYASADWAHEAELMLRSRINQVLLLTSRSEALGNQISGEEARYVLAAFEQAIGELLCCGLLSKVVPDALAEVLRQSGDNRPPPITTPSAGARLSQALSRLVGQCAVDGYAPALLASDWPNVRRPVKAAICDFCRAHRGFGPLAWEAPGYEDPRYVVNVTSQLWDGSHPNLLDSNGYVHLEELGAIPDPMEGPGLRRLLALWLHFLDYETFYVRRAFLVGVIPALRVLSRELDKRGLRNSPGDLLFARIGELVQAPLERAQSDQVTERRRAYESDAGHLVQYGNADAPLDDLVGGLR